jgi:hypothetical protein
MSLSGFVPARMGQISESRAEAHRSGGKAP